MHAGKFPGGAAPAQTAPARSEKDADAGRGGIDFTPPADSGKRKADPPPKPRKRKPVAPDKPDDAALVAMLGELLTMPAIPAAMVWHCDYCRDHFLSEGPKAARELVALSLTNPALRSALESLHSGWSKITIAGVLAGYLAKPLMHHVAPEPVLAAAGPVLGVPPRPPKPEHAHGDAPQAEHPGPDSPPAEHERSAAADQYPRDPATGFYAA